MSVFNYKVSTHVLDTNKGRPVTDLVVKLYKLKNGNEWMSIDEGKTEANGRCTDFKSSNEPFTAAWNKVSNNNDWRFERSKRRSFITGIDIDSVRRLRDCRTTNELFRRQILSISVPSRCRSSICSVVNNTSSSTFRNSRSTRSSSSSSRGFRV